MTPQQIGASLVYGAMGLYCGFVLYLIAERIWISIRRWLDHYRVQKAFKLDMDSGFIAEHNAIQRVGFADQGLLIETVRAEMFPKRESDEDDADYSALTEYELEKSA